MLASKDYLTTRNRQQMVYDGKKCKVCNCNQNHETLHSCKMNNTTLALLMTIILYDSKLSFNEHIKNIVKSAKKMFAYLIHNCSCFTHIVALKALEFSLIRSKLEHRSFIWYRIYVSNKILTENIQRRFLKFLGYKISNVYLP